MNFESLRTGLGYDIHPLVEERLLWLGGVLIPSIKGLLGHSDADVLTHSLCDALLSAADLGDIGQHFPPGVEKYHNIRSTELLKEVVAMIGQRRFKVINTSSVVILESPKIMSYAPNIKAVLADILQIPAGRVSISATTKEGLDAVGQGQAAEAYTSALIYQLD